MTEEPLGITLSDDEMEAWIRFASDATLPLEVMARALREAGVVYGIDPFLLQDLAEAHQPGQWYGIAKGMPPEDGLKFHFSRRQEQPPKRLPDGRIDFYNLGTIQHVEQQQVLVSKIPLQSRRPGKTVTGKAVPPLTEDVDLPRAGANVALTDDKMALIALINGYPVFVDHCLWVDPTYALEGDVDFSTGHIICTGDVMIAGDIKSGFRVKSAGEVTVHGVVDGGEIEAGLGVHLYGNVLGQHKSYIRCAESVSGLYVDAATIEAEKNITLSRGVRRSYLKAGGSILVQGDRGSIIGGESRACERILCHDLGSENGIATLIEIIPHFDAANCHKFLQHMTLALEEDGKWVAEQLGQQREQETFSDFQQLIEQCQAALPSLAAYMDRPRQMRRSGCLSSGVVIATGTVYPGVTICIERVSLAVTRPMAQVVFSHADGVIHVRPLDATGVHAYQVG